MPWVRKANRIYKELPSGKLKLVQTCTSVENAKKALNLRRGIEHGWTPAGKPARSTKKKTTTAKRKTTKHKKTGKRK